MERETILIVEDNRELCEVFNSFLANEFKTLCAHSLHEARCLLSKYPVHGILLDLQLPDGLGLDLIKELKDKGGSYTIIVVTAYGSISTAVEAMRDGAYDFLEKPVDLEALLEKFKKGLLKNKPANHNEEFPVVYSKKMKSIIELVNKVAPTGFPVLITGESGAGKEVIANLIHLKSGRKKLIPFNCANLPYELTDSLLFGHVKGSFTGATENKPGLVEMSNEGTLFLDEVGELPLQIQPKLLRFLDSGTYFPVGSTREKRSSARVIAATNKDLAIEANTGRFRKDLFYRLSNIVIEVPPLRERTEDIIPLVNYHLRELSKKINKTYTLTQDAEEILLNYDYPGNVRELFNIINKATILCKDNIISGDDIRKIIGLKKEIDIKKQEPILISENNENLSIKEVILNKERETIENLLRECKFNKREVARRLGISYRTLFNKLKKLNIPY